MRSVTFSTQNCEGHASGSRAYVSGRDHWVGFLRQTATIETSQLEETLVLKIILTQRSRLTYRSLSLSCYYFLFSSLPPGR